MNKLLDRFFHYVSFDTQSKVGVKQIPSTDGQLKLAQEIKNELISLGLEDVTLDKHGYVMATLPSNVKWQVPTIGFVAHLDTSPDFSGKNVTPQLIEGYRGGDIALGIGDEVLSPVQFPILHQMIGKSLITTDGKTLLGADNKAGVAEIITAIVRLKESNVPHGKIRIGFTPDEEVGKGADLFDVEKFGAEWAYTIDGGAVGELEYENFNAASVVIKIAGNNVHPGTAKGIMVNALTLATRIHQMLPAMEVPEHTDGYEGFYHLQSIKGTVEHAEMRYIIRDFTQEGFESRKANMMRIAETIGKELQHNAHIDIEITDSYFNMKEKVAEHPHIIELAKQAMTDCDITPELKPIRGGTDGARLSFKGLPCPNIFTGGYNFHGKHEFITVEGMEDAVSVIVRLAEITAEKYKA